MSLRAFGVLLKARQLTRLCRQANRAATFALSTPSLHQLPSAGKDLQPICRIVAYG